jgi:hypothetical protein
VLKNFLAFIKGTAYEIGHRKTSIVKITLDMDPNRRTWSRGFACPTFSDSWFINKGSKTFLAKEKSFKRFFRKKGLDDVLLKEYSRSNPKHKRQSKSKAPLEFLERKNNEPGKDGLYFYVKIITYRG